MCYSKATGWHAEAVDPDAGPGPAGVATRRLAGARKRSLWRALARLARRSDRARGRTPGIDAITLECRRDRKRATVIGEPGLGVQGRGARLGLPPAAGDRAVRASRPGGGRRRR